MAIEVSSLPFLQMIEKAEAELRSLASQRTEVQSQLSAIEAESHRLAAQRNQRVVDASKSAETIETLGDQLARLYAEQKLSEGTLAPSVDIVIEDVREQMARAVEAERAMRERHAMEEQRELGLVDQSEASTLLFHQRLRDLETQIKATEQVRSEAHHQMGDAELASIMASLVSIQEKLDEAEQEGTRLKDERKKLIEAGKVALAEWPEHARAIAMFLPHEDNVTALLEKYLAWITALAAMPRPFELPREITSPVTGGGILDLLSLPYYEEINVPILLDRFERVAKVVEAYRERHRT